MKSALTAALIFLSGLFGSYHGTAVFPPAHLPAAAVAITAAAPASLVAPTAIPLEQFAVASGQPQSQLVPTSSQRGATTTASTAAAPRATYVTQDQLAAALDQATNPLRTLIYQNDSVPGSLPATGGFTNNIALTNRIDQLTGTKLSNITVNGVSGLTASDIPSLSGSYLPLAGGMLSGTLFVPTLSASSTNYSLLTATNASTTLFSNFGTAYFGGTATSSFSSTGALTLAEPLALTSGGLGTTTGDISALVSKPLGATSAQSIAARAALTLTPQDFGAKCDGVTDDTTALQAWINQIISSGNRGYIPPGTWVHTGLTMNVTAASHGVIIDGAGAGQSVLKLKAGSNANSITYTGAQNFGNQAMTVLSNFTIDGNYPSNTSGDGIHLVDLPGGSYPFGPQFINITILHAATDGLYIGTNKNNGTDNNLWISHSGRNGVTMLAGDWKFDSSYFYGSDQAGLAITGAVNNGSGLIQLTVSAHGLVTGQSVLIDGVQGTTEANGLWTITSIDTNHIDLQGSTFSNTYTSNGRVVPVFNVIGAASDGGLIQLTTDQAHGWSTGQQVLVRAVGGVPRASGLGR